MKLEEKVLELQEKCNDNEQYSRRYNVCIYGVNPTSLESDESSGMKEDCSKSVIDFCSDELGVVVERREEFAGKLT